MIGAAIIAHGCSCRVRAVTMIIARLQRVRPASPPARMNAVVPVEIVIRSHSIPSPVVRFERVMIPAIARVSRAYDDALTCKTHRPDERGAREADSRLNGFRSERFAIW